MSELHEQVREGFLKYGTSEWVSEHYVRQSLEWEMKYKTVWYAGDEIPDSWDDYIIINNDDNDDVANGDVNEDMQNEGEDEGDGFAYVDIEND